MIVTGAGFHVQAVDYELLQLSRVRPRAIGDFRDVHLKESGPWRVVAGYLALQQGAPGEPIDVISHGRAVGAVDIDAAPRIRFSATASIDGDLAQSEGAGIAIVGSSLRALTAAEVGVEEHDWEFTIVHGPAEDKVRNRVALLRSLVEVGGRRG